MNTRHRSQARENHLIFLGSICAIVCLIATGCKTAAPPQTTTTAPPASAKPKAEIKAAKSDAEIEPAIKQAAALSSAPLEGDGWKPLFDGTDLNGWEQTDFAGRAETDCEAGLIVINAGTMLSGINCTNTNSLPKMNYEIALDAMKLKGSDFFCGLTFPVADSYCSLICGGWGGATTGLSSVDEEDASENETTQAISYDDNRWYRIRVRVTTGKIQAWLDDKKIIDLKTKERRIALRFGEIEFSAPLGIATYQTSAAIRNFKIRPIESDTK